MTLSTAQGLNYMVRLHEAPDHVLVVAQGRDSLCVLTD